ncbi:2-oxo acid dehydrogenase subunit E2 [Paracoccus sp. WLY502]|uniref:dihydrolipoamide acetyltransferase family protein n=1 Tax=Paracoccus yibinensis TaxID=3068891 RepID=UPI0027963D5A|nr:2-oxo acid dehydrogenase subunit E2 [Paracoccus sp. WLY502]MDQ1901595.1 2-oxo acid dehydrogenase subunit E2 [Paracoccus sp. WLY502]
MVDVLVPLEQEGTEAVVSSWLRAVGDLVIKDDPLLELETDKVSVEVPAPSSGRLAEILIDAGQKALPGAVLARIEAADPNPANLTEPAPAAEAAFSPEASRTCSTGRDMTAWHSPSVRKALAETGIDPKQVEGSGRNGRLTRADVDAAAARLRERNPALHPEPEAVAQPKVPPPPTATPASGSRLAGTSVPHDQMRLAIARNMVKSVTEAPQVTAVFEADFSAIMAHRNRNKDAFAADGISLSYTAYIILAAARAMEAMPQVNSRWHSDRLEIFGDVNIGIGTALGDKGLIVPVIRRVQDLSLKGVASRLQDVTQRARNGKLVAEDMRDGTFTISNHGVSGSLFASPIIINQPQSAILGIGKLEKRVVVREVGGVDTIQVRPMAYVSLTIDHRVLDGHQTNGWLTAFVAALEGWKD